MEGRLPATAKGWFVTAERRILGDANAMTVASYAMSSNGM